MSQRNQAGFEYQNEAAQMVEAMMVPATKNARISEFVHSEIGFPPSGIVVVLLVS
jgi:hypothetical protein